MIRLHLCEPDVNLRCAIVVVSLSACFQDKKLVSVPQRAKEGGVSGSPLQAA